MAKVLGGSRTSLGNIRNNLLIVMPLYAAGKTIQSLEGSRTAIQLGTGVCTLIRVAEDESLPPALPVEPFGFVSLPQVSRLWRTESH